MELKEYIKIIKKNKNLFFGTIIAVVAIALGYFFFLPVRYDASLTLNVTRTGSQETTDYKYDDYYRLQADERFVDTIVEWIRSPRVVSDIYTEAGIDAGAFSMGKFSKNITAEKRSSQIVAISFSATSIEAAQKISAGVTKIITKNTNELNVNQKENTWFSVLSAAPVIVKYQPNYGLNFLASLCLGIFLGFWVVLFKHYLE